MESNVDDYLKVSVDFSKNTLETYFSRDHLIVIKNALYGNKMKKLIVLLKNASPVIVHNVLAHAVHRGMTKTVKKIIKHFYSQNDPKYDINLNKSEIFKFAIYYNRKDIIVPLLKVGTDVHADNDLVLLKYCSLGDSFMVKILLNYGANFNIDNNSPLIYCAISGHLDIIDLFLEKGLIKNTINDLDDNNQSMQLTNFDLAMMAASKNNHFSIAKKMLELGANANINNAEALIISAEKGYIDIVKLLLEHGANPNALDGMALKKSAVNGHYDIVKILAEHKNIDGEYVCDLSIDDSVALRWATYKGHYDIVKFLLESKTIEGKPRCNVNANNDESFHLASKYNHTDILDLLIKYGATNNYLKN